MAHKVKRGVLLTGLAPLAEVQKHVMKGSARLTSYQRMGAEVLDLFRVKLRSICPWTSTELV